MGINFSFFFFMLNLLPETMPKAQRQKFTWRNLNPFIYCTYDTATQPLLLLLLPSLHYHCCCCRCHCRYHCCHTAAAGAAATRS
jgi:hypothetical protein